MIVGLLSDREIENSVKILPFDDGRAKPGVISYGLTSYGYDARVGYKFKVFTNVYGAVIDPKAFRPEAFVDVDLTPGTETRHKVTRDSRDIVTTGTFRHVCCVCGKRWPAGAEDEATAERCGPPHPDHVVIPPNSFALAETVEHFEIPRDVLAVCVGKSTYARCGIIVNVTPLEPEWRGKVTVEISNTTPLPAKIYAGEGIAQILFFRAADVCRVSYADKKGKYQDQPGLVLPRVS